MRIIKRGKNKGEKIKLPLFPEWKFEFDRGRRITVDSFKMSIIDNVLTLSFHDLNLKSGDDFEFQCDVTKINTFNADTGEAIDLRQSVTLWQVLWSDYRKRG